MMGGHPSHDKTATSDMVIARHVKLGGRPGIGDGRRGTGYQRLVSHLVLWMDDDGRNILRNNQATSPGLGLQYGHK